MRKSKSWHGVFSIRLLQAICACSRPCYLYAQEVVVENDLNHSQCFKQKKRKTHLYILATMMLLASSCHTIHEFRDCPQDDSTLINLDVKVSFNVNDLQNMDPGTVTRSVSTDQCLRFIFEIYKYDNSDRPAMRREATVTQIDPHQVTLAETFALTASKYYILVWADYLNTSMKTDQFYSTQSLHSISFVEPFISDTDNRDCFVGIAEVDLLSYQGEWDIHVPMTVPLYRPVAKYALIANDIDKYMARLPAGRQSRAESIINSYTAVVWYPGYMPNSFNVRTSQPNDSRNGLWYASKCYLLHNNEALICFDYPFVNGTKSEAKLNLQLYDDQGKLINEIQDITVPIKRDSLTVIRSDYFTRQYSPGININPGYEGNIDITLPD